jgi:hypothetical protein
VQCIGKFTDFSLTSTLVGIAQTLVIISARNVPSRLPVTLLMVVETMSDVRNCELEEIVAGFSYSLVLQHHFVQT